MANDDVTMFERQVEADRAELGATLDRLSQTLSPQNARQQTLETVERYGTQVAGQLWDATRENPAGFALVGAGLALLLSDTGRRSENDGRAEQKRKGAVPPDEAMDGFDRRVAQADAAIQEASEKQKDTPRPMARQMRAALNWGLEKLPPDARARVRDARMSAIQAQEEIERRGSKMKNRLSEIVDDQPIAVAAACFGLGALLGAALPATQREDELLGARRDALMERASTALAEELETLREKVSDVPGASVGSNDAPSPNGQAQS